MSLKKNLKNKIKLKRRSTKRKSTKRRSTKRRSTKRRSKYNDGMDSEELLNLFNKSKSGYFNEFKEDVIQSDIIFRKLLEIKKNIKVLLLGCKGSGKTTFLNRLQTGNYTREYIETIGVNIVTYSYEPQRIIFEFVEYGDPGDIEDENDPIFEELIRINNFDMVVYFLDNSLTCHRTINKYHRIITNNENTRRMPALIVRTKSELISSYTFPYVGHRMSLETGEGVFDLLDIIIEKVND